MLLAVPGWLDVQILRERGALLDEAKTGFGFGAHQGIDRFGHIRTVAADLDVQLQFAAVQVEVPVA